MVCLQNTKVFGTQLNKDHAIFNSEATHPTPSQSPALGLLSFSNNSLFRQAERCDLRVSFLYMSCIGVTHAPVCAYHQHVPSVSSMLT